MDLSTATLAGKASTVGQWHRCWKSGDCYINWLVAEGRDRGTGLDYTTARVPGLCGQRPGDPVMERCAQGLGRRWFVRADSDRPGRFLLEFVTDRGLIAFELDSDDAGRDASLAPGVDLAKPGEVQMVAGLRQDEIFLLSDRALGSGPT